MMKIMMHTTMAMTPIFPPSFSKFCCRGVALAEVSGKQPHFVLGLLPSSPAMSCAMRPILVDMPVSQTMPLPLPFVTLQPEKTMFSGRSFSGSPGFFTFNLAVLATSSGSPVSAISLTFTSSASTRRKSAGTTSPVPRTTTSPRTTAGTSIFTSWPSRSTKIAACVIFDNASNASPALCSVHAAMPAFRITMTKMALPVVYDKMSSLFGPVALTAMEAMAATRSNMMTNPVS
mmetsp:Transcript_125864/g.364170  ORF Transcript_125864/g.364170 Transcript_125864/m.364170 type:complete len:232 (-) Transcript_125864:262-957(-)